MLRRVVLAVVSLERWLAVLLVRLGGPVRVAPFHGFGADGWARVGGRVLVAAPPRGAVVQVPRRTVPAQSGTWAVVRANLLPFFTVEVPRARVRLLINGREEGVHADGDGYVYAELLNLELPGGRHTVTLTPVEPPGRPSSATIYVLNPAADLVVISDVDDTIVDSGIAHGLWATLGTTLLREQSTRVPLIGAPELYRALAQGGEPTRPFFYLSTSPWNLVGFLQTFLVRHGFPEGPLLLTDWGPSTSSLLRASSQEHKLTALRELAQQIPRASFVLLGDTGQQDPAIYARFASEHPGRVAAVYVRRAGRPGAAAEMRAAEAEALLAGLQVPFLVTVDSEKMLSHARRQGLVP
jgi:phosphatidate phosphatase APP1